MSSHFLDSDFQRDLVAALLPEARFEHEAIHVFAPDESMVVGRDTDPLRHACAQYTNLGYTLVRASEEIAFLVRQAHRVELILTTTPEHIGYVFPYGDPGRELYHQQVGELKSLPIIWEYLEDGTDSTRSYVLFRHVSTGLVLQVLHRERPLFEGIEW